MKAVGYTRVSSESQVDNSSLQSQKETITAYATMKQIELVEIFEDKAVSGGMPLGDRPAGHGMLRLLEEEQADSIIITKLDRAFRNALDCLANIEVWEKRGISLHILNLGGQSIDTSTPTGKFFITLLAGVGELEKAMINERCLEGRRKKISDGFFVGGSLEYGFDFVDPDDPDNRKLEENPAERSIIQTIVELKRNRSLCKVAEELNRQGIPTKTGKKWTHVQVGRILRRAA